MYFYIQLFKFKGLIFFSIHNLFLRNLFFKTVNLSVHIVLHKKIFFFFFSLSLIFIPSFIIQNITD